MMNIKYVTHIRYISMNITLIYLLNLHIAALNLTPNIVENRAKNKSSGKLC